MRNERCEADNLTVVATWLGLYRRQEMKPASGFAQDILRSIRRRAYFRTAIYERHERSLKQVEETGPFLFNTAQRVNARIDPAGHKLQGLVVLGAIQKMDHMRNGIKRDSFRNIRIDQFKVVFRAQRRRSD